MSYTAQELNTKVTLQRFTETVDEAGQPIQTWVTYAEAFAKVEPMVGREYMLAGSLPVGEVKLKATLRYRDDVDRLDRIIIRGDAFDIVDAQNIKFRNRELLLYCKRVE